MSKKADPEASYEVGYCKPPKDTQWQKGQSGNPSGKKKKEESLLEKLKKLAAKEVIVQQNGVSVAMTQEDAMLATAYFKAINGDFKNFKFLYEQLAAAAGQSEITAPALNEEMLNVLQTHADWMGMVEAVQSELADADNDVDGDDGTF